MEKNFKTDDRYIGSAIRQRSGPYRPSGRGLCAGRYLRALSAPEKRKTCSLSEVRMNMECPSLSALKKEGVPHRILWTVITPSLRIL